MSQEVAPKIQNLFIVIEEDAIYKLYNTYYIIHIIIFSIHENPQNRGFIFTMCF